MTDLTETIDTSTADGTSLPPPVFETVLNMWGQGGEQHLIPITGRSMLPLIRAGDLVLVSHDRAGIRRGDIVVFRQDGRLIAHRVLRIRGPGAEPMFVTMGDNAWQLDPPVKARALVGRVLVIKRNDRFIVVNTPTWRRVSGLIAIGMLVGVKLYGWGRRFKHKLWGERPLRLTAFLRRSVTAFFALVLKVVQGLTRSWKK